MSNFDLQAAGCSLDSFDSATVNLIVGSLGILISSGTEQIQVEGNQYTVPRFFLIRDSPVLCEMFSTPTDTVREAWTLAGVTREELEHLLWVYYNP